MDEEGREEIHREGTRNINYCDCFTYIDCCVLTE
jgi:hypothetical protein